MNKDLVCDAFCSSLDMRPVPAGYAVTTPYTNADGDPLLIYFVRDERSRWRLEDDGTQIALLEANGVNLTGRARGEAFHELLQFYGMQFDDDARTLRSPPLTEAEIGEASVRFLGLLLRLQDFTLMSPKVTRSNFREDALEAIHAAFDGFAHVSDQGEISPELGEADVVIRAPAAAPVGIYLATSEERALQSLVVKMEADKYRDIATSIVLLLEHAKDNPLKPFTYGLALARLDAVVSFREARHDGLARIAKAAGLNDWGARVQ